MIRRSPSKEALKAKANRNKRAGTVREGKSKRLAKRLRQGVRNGRGKTLRQGVRNGRVKRLCVRSGRVRLRQGIINGRVKRLREARDKPLEHQIQFRPLVAMSTLVRLKNTRHLLARQREKNTGCLSYTIYLFRLRLDLLKALWIQQISLFRLFTPSQFLFPLYL